MKISCPSLFFVLYTCLASCLHGQTAFTSSHPIALASSENAVILKGALSLYANPASALAHGAKIDLTASYQSRFSTDIRSINGAASWTFGNQAGGLILQRYGIDGFIHTNAAVNYSRSIGSKAYLALQPTYTSLQIEGLGQRSSLDLNLGYWQQLNNGLALSLHVSQLSSFLSTEVGDQIGGLNLGLSINLGPQAEFYHSIGYTSDKRWDYRPGILYRPHHIIDLYFSFDTSPSSFAGGAQIDIKEDLGLLLGYNSHPILGSTLSVGLRYSSR